MTVILLTLGCIAFVLLMFALFDSMGFASAAGTIDGLQQIANDPAQLGNALLGLVITVAIAFIGYGLIWMIGAYLMRGGRTLEQLHEQGLINDEQYKDAQ